MNLRSIRKLFARSPDTHRSVLFWHWPTALPPKTVEREIDDILANGVGGVLIDSPPSSHAADYLDDDWLTALTAATSRARKRHDSVWIFDDLASANSPAKTQRRVQYPEHAATYLQFETLHATNKTLNSLQDDLPYAVFVREGLEHRQIDQSEWQTLTDVNAELLCVHHRRSEIHLRYLHAESVRDYLDQTYAPIRQKTKRFFGNTLGVILANNAELHAGPDILPWDEDLPEIFEKAFGYSLIPELPSLITETASIHATCYHFWTLIADLFREGLGHTFQTWGEEHKIPVCGFFPMSQRGNAEKPQPFRTTGPRMPLYALQPFPTVRLSLDAPGFDDLFEIKQAVSVQHQGKTRGPIGVYQPTAHPMSLESWRDAAYTHIALGVTYRTIDGAFTRPHTDQSPLPYLLPGDTAWPWMKTGYDRMARLTWIHSLGTRQCRVLLLLPEASMQSQSLDSERNVLFDNHIELLTNHLFRNQIDFDFGDEHLMALHARASHDCITMNDAQYSIVVMPPMINLRSSTFALLQDFTMSGGRLLCIGTVPYQLDGESNADLGPFFETYARRIINGIDLFDHTVAIDTLKKWNAPAVAATYSSRHSARECLVKRSKLEDIEFVHFTRVTRNANLLRIEFDVDTEGHIEFWNHIDGTMTPVCPCTPDEPVVIEDEWQGTEARTYVILPEPLPEDVEPEAPLVVERTLEPRWTAIREHGIPHTLQTCRFAGHPWADLQVAQQNLRERLSGNPDGVIGHFQWILPDDAFESGLDHQLVLIAPENITAELNHSPLEQIDNPAISLPGYTGFTLPEEPGTLQIEGKFKHADLISAPIIIPKAKRDSDSGEIEAIPVTLAPWNNQGLEGFAHTVTYRAEIQGYERFDDAPIMLECEGLRSPAEVRINGNVVGHLLWEPYNIDIRPYWTAGPLAIELEVAGTWANVFHPQERLPHQGLDSPPRIVIHAHTSSD